VGMLRDAGMAVDGGGDWMIGGRRMRGRARRDRREVGRYVHRDRGYSAVRTTWVYRVDRRGARRRGQDRCAVSYRDD
jgi:hypothetical protein